MGSNVKLAHILINNTHGLTVTFVLLPALQRAYSVQSGTPQKIIINKF